VTRAGDPREAASRDWYGYGRWDAPYWFIGMEPGGDDDLKSYEAREALAPDRTGLIDCRRHHMSSTDPKWTRWHRDGPRRTQPTWRRLIQVLLGYKGEPTDLDSVCQYQRTDLGSLTGETAVVELGELHAPGLATKLDRETYRNGRIETLHDRLVEREPTFALCYGLTFREHFEKVVGSAFEDGFTSCGPTLCVLTPGPTSARGDAWGRPEWWIAKGLEIRNRVATGGGRRKTAHAWSEALFTPACCARSRRRAIEAPNRSTGFCWRTSCGIACFWDQF